MSKEAELGTLIVVILKARNLNDRHSFYKQDVFAQASLNGATKRTRVDVKGGQHPIWDEELRFPVARQATDNSRKLEVACFSKEARSQEILGKVDITETLRTGEFDDWVSLSVDGVVRGDIYLEMTYYANAPAPVSSLAVPPSNLTRRPSKLAPSERLYRPAQGLASPAKVPPQAGNRIHPGQWDHVQQHADSHHLAPSSPHSSRSSSAASARRSESPLPPLPESDLASASLPTTLLPGGGRPKPQPQKVTPYVPTNLRPGTGANPAAPAPTPHTRITPSNHYPSTSPPRGEYVPPVTSPTYGYNALASQPSHNPGPGRGRNPAPPASFAHPAPTTPQLWVSDNPPQGPLSFPVPTVVPAHDSGVSYELSNPHPPAHEAPVASYRPSVGSDLPDPYLQARYQTPLPLPPGATASPPRGRQSLPGPARPDEEADRLRLAKEEEARRKEQEEKDLALALQLDRELNLGEGTESQPQVNSIGDRRGMPGGLNPVM
ncbi:hypothetical protein Hypma_006472 [Hypsizygus marmoreus]|uniref:C2 domain-containing protein n=1 Tax=Hypsizygus marmoreus TaxID=39966 RepID=A0A369JUR1_HYPMA|nr:hypothetical protein Hypma_006472 [Hypsizygus marmoreus]